MSMTPMRGLEYLKPHRMVTQRIIEGKNRSTRKGIDF
jgi:hypothetical protein